MLSMFRSFLDSEFHNKKIIEVPMEAIFALPFYFSVSELVNNFSYIIMLLFFDQLNPYQTVIPFIGHSLF